MSSTSDSVARSSSSDVWLPEQHDQRCPARQGGVCVLEEGCRPRSYAPTPSEPARVTYVRTYQVSGDNCDPFVVVNTIPEALRVAGETLAMGSRSVSIHRHDRPEEDE